MAKKRRKVQKPVVYIAAEGDREQCLINYMQKLLDPENAVKIKFSPEKGGSSNAILNRALKNDFYDKVYAWFDEDDELDDDFRKILSGRWKVKLSRNVTDRELQQLNSKKRKPIVIVSYPLSVEGVIIRLFDKNLPQLLEPIRSAENFEENKKRMKSAVQGIFGKLTDEEYYEKHLTLEQLLNKAETMPEIALLVSIFDKK